MKKRKKILLFIVIIISFITIVLYDEADRSQFYSVIVSKEEFKIFFMHKTSEEQEKAYEENFGKEKYKFPRKEVAEIKLYKNVFLLSRLTSKKITKIDKKKLLNFFNNPENFSWGETTWSKEDSEYILRFFDEKENEIGKIWLSIKDCGMTESIPFSPNMKYGGLSKVGKENIEDILNGY
jgi:hypothetical protein